MADTTDAPIASDAQAAKRAYIRRWNAANRDRLADYRKRAAERMARMSKSELAEKRERDKATWDRSNAKRSAERASAKAILVRACDTCGKVYQPDRINGRFCTDKCGRVASRYPFPPRPCERCGKKFRAPDSNPEQRFCGNRCSYDTRAPTLPARNCASCGHLFQPRRAEQVTCGPACGYAMRRQKNADAKRRPCKNCGALFVPIKHDGIYCSRACMGLVKQRLQNRQISVICEICGKSFQAKRHRAAVKFCSNACRGATPLHPFKVHAALLKADGDIRRKRQCEQCGKVFQAITAATNKRFCSNDCTAASRRLYADRKEAARVWTASRRGRQRGAAYEQIVARVVFERDDWRCYLCGEMTNRAHEGLRKADAPTVDHVVPIVRGGAHLYSNVKCAHRGCNGRKHHRLLSEIVEEHKRLMVEGADRIGRKVRIPTGGFAWMPRLWLAEEHLGEGLRK